MEHHPNGKSKARRYMIVRVNGHKKEYREVHPNQTDAPMLRPGERMERDSRGNVYIYPSPPQS